MTATNILLIAAALLLAGLFLNPRLLRSPDWRATVTPLASIIGSGFLVAGPILAATAGRLAWLAMLGLCAAGYLFGSAIRHNIRHVEPLLAQQPPAPVALLERGSDLALSVAYFVSVAYYLNLFAAFGLRLAGSSDPLQIRILATLVIGAVGALGYLGGLRAMERLAVGAVGLKLSLIGGVLVALLGATLLSLGRRDFAWPVLPQGQGGHELAILLGLVILVQGFETSRYLGEAYDAETRIRTMRRAQWISSGIYIGFILLITAYFSAARLGQGDETAIIDMLRPLGPALAPIIILAALASQLSAAVSDTNGAGGLLAESLGARFGVHLGNLVTALAAMAITWMADIFAIIAYASQVFVLYYALQCLQAGLSAWRLRQRGRAVLYLAGLLVAAIVIVFAIPADA